MSHKFALRKLRGGQPVKSAGQFFRIVAKLEEHHDSSTNVRCSRNPAGWFGECRTGAYGGSIFTLGPQVLEREGLLVQPSVKPTFTIKLLLAHKRQLKDVGTTEMRGGNRWYRRDDPRSLSNETRLSGKQGPEYIDCTSPRL